MKLAVWLNDRNPRWYFWLVRNLRRLSDWIDRNIYGIEPESELDPLTSELLDEKYGTARPIPKE